MKRAACRGLDPRLFFPERDEYAIVEARNARAVWSTCPVRAECLDYALTNDEQFGMWGGLSLMQRRALNAATRGRVDERAWGSRRRRAQSGRRAEAR